MAPEILKLQFGFIYNFGSYLIQPELSREIAFKDRAKAFKKPLNLFPFNWLGFW